MRLALVGLVTIATTLTVGMQSGNAQEADPNVPYCTRGGESGMLNCSYFTWQQCIETARGLRRYCVSNPFYRGPRERPTTQDRSRRHNR